MFRASGPYVVRPRLESGFYRDALDYGTPRELKLDGVQGLTATIARYPDTSSGHAIHEIVVRFYEAETGRLVGYADIDVYDLKCYEHSDYVCAWLNTYTDYRQELEEAAKHYWAEFEDWEDEANAPKSPGLTPLFQFGGAVAVLKLFEFLPGSSKGEGRASLCSVIRALQKRFRIGMLLVTPFPLQFKAVDEPDKASTPAIGSAVEQAVKKLRRYYATLLPGAERFWTSDGTLALNLPSRPKSSQWYCA
ncbi:hypothetical protein D3C71_25420 [compost metagenome]